MTRKLMLLALTAAALAAACADAKDATSTRRYMCEDGASFFARFRPEGVVLDFGNGASVGLAAQPGTKPQAYAGKAGEFRLTNDGRATLTKAGGQPVSCRVGDVRNLAVIH